MSETDDVLLPRERDAMQLVGGPVNAANVLVGAVTRLARELREDKERLDWLDAEALRRRDDETQESYYDLSRVHLDTNSFGVWVAGTLRTAIDAARAAQEVRDG